MRDFSQKFSTAITSVDKSHLEITLGRLHRDIGLANRARMKPVKKAEMTDVKCIRLCRLHNRLKIEDSGQFKIGLRERMDSPGVRIANAESQKPSSPTVTRFMGFSMDRRRV